LTELRFISLSFISSCASQMTVDSQHGVLYLDAETRRARDVACQPYESIDPMIGRDQAHHLADQFLIFFRLVTAKLFERLRPQRNFHQRLVIDPIADDQVDSQAAVARAEQ